nr:MAG TPA: chromatin protein [Caudoviricetes sp.]
MIPANHRHALRHRRGALFLCPQTGHRFRRSSRR